MKSSLATLGLLQNALPPLSSGPPAPFRGLWVPPGVGSQGPRCPRQRHRARALVWPPPFHNPTPATLKGLALDPRPESTLRAEPQAEQVNPSLQGDRGSARAAHAQLWHRHALGSQGSGYGWLASQPPMGGRWKSDQDIPAVLTQKLHLYPARTVSYLGDKRQSREGLVHAHTH